jgi:hypothetical protein
MLPRFAIDGVVKKVCTPEAVELSNVPEVGNVTVVLPVSVTPRV